jgi:polar amino acid transport system permease protein
LSLKDTSVLIIYGILMGFAIAIALSMGLTGLVNTLVLTALGILLGTILGILLAVGRSYGKKPLSLFILIYEKVLRGIPLLVIFFLIYFGLPQIGINLNAITSAILGLGLRSAAYQSQIFRGAINSIPKGQIDAAYSLGMSKLKSVQHIILPQVLRLSIPGWSNEFTILLKDTSIAFTIGVIDLMRQARYIQVREPDLVLVIYLLIAFIYLVFVLSANKGLYYLEKKYQMVGYKTEAHR